MKLVYISWTLLVVIVTILIGQTFRLQIVEGYDQAMRAQQNRFRIQTLFPQRGLFYDVDGKPLVSQTPYRKYLYAEAFAHVLGYRGEADEKELVLFGVEPSEWIGKIGLERTENSRLRGQIGGALLEYSAANQLVRTLSRSEPVAGRSLQLSLDAGLQQHAYALIKQTRFRGVAIASTRDGHILALVSVPSFDPNLFEQLKETPANQATTIRNELNRLFQDSQHPLFNRAIAGLYPPASTFKIITALAALDKKVISARTEIEDTGELRVGTFRYGTWYYDQYGRKEGLLTVAKALRRSNDIFFYRVGAEVGIDVLSEWAQKMGYGRLTGIGLVGEAEGLVPNPTWKQATLSDDWFLGDTYITAIGQGNLQTTPLQVHQVMQIVANGGYACPPKMILAAVDQAPAAYTHFDSHPLDQCQLIQIDQENLHLVTQGLHEACEVGGTGWPLFNFKISKSKFKLPNLIDGKNYIEEASGSARMVRIPVACKTGTAETGRSSFENGKEKFYTHAWFTAFAPVEKPEIVVTVLLEDAGQGSDKAGPIVREMMKYWFERENQ